MSEGIHEEFNWHQSDKLHILIGLVLLEACPNLELYVITSAQCVHVRAHGNFQCYRKKWSFIHHHTHTPEKTTIGSYLPLGFCNSAKQAILVSGALKNVICSSSSITLIRVGFHVLQATVQTQVRCGCLTVKCWVCGLYNRHFYITDN